MEGSLENFFIQPNAFLNCRSMKKEMLLHGTSKAAVHLKNVSKEDIPAEVESALNTMCNSFEFISICIRKKGRDEL